MWRSFYKVCYLWLNLFILNIKLIFLVCAQAAKFFRNSPESRSIVNISGVTKFTPVLFSITGINLMIISFVFRLFFLSFRILYVVFAFRNANFVYTKFVSYYTNTIYENFFSYIFLYFRIILNLYKNFFLELLERRCNCRNVLCVVDTHIHIRLSTILYSCFKFLFSEFVL